MKRRCISIDKQTNVHTVYESIEAASRGTNVSCTQIRRIAKMNPRIKISIFL